MPTPAQERVEHLLSRLNNLDTARELFGELNYDVARVPLSRA